MNNAFRAIPIPPRSSQVSRLVISVACLLIGIRFVAGFVCYTCFNDFEKPISRSFHLHAGGDLNPCHHGRVEASPLTNWACTVTQDESAFILPEIPRLPVMVSFFVPLLLLVVSYGDRLLIAAHGRSPPICFA